MLSSSCVLAGSMGPEALTTNNHAFVYLGGSIGYGKVSGVLPSTSMLFENATDDGFNAIIHDLDLLRPKTLSGGFSGRAYTGYLFGVSSAFSIGPEIGFSAYKGNSRSENTTISPPGPGAFTLLSDASSRVYGVDLLANEMYFFSDSISVYAKPGIQLAFESQQFNGSISGDVPKTGEVNFQLSNNVNRTAIAPEIIVGTNWRLPINAPLFLGASYQYVFNQFDLNENTAMLDLKRTINSRQLLSLNLEYHI